MSCEIYNQITFKNKTDCDKVKEILKSEKSKIDFNSIIPIPECVKNTIAGSDDLIATSILKYLIELEIVSIGDENDIKFAINRLYPSLKIDGCSQAYRGIGLDKDTDTKFYIFPFEIMNKMKNILNDHTLDKKEYLHDYINPNRYPLSFQELGKNYLESIVKHGVKHWRDWHIKNWKTIRNVSYIKIDESSIYFQTLWTSATAIIEKLAEKTKVPMLYQFAEEQIKVMSYEIVFNEKGKICYETPENTLFVSEICKIYSHVKDKNQKLVKFIDDAPVFKSNYDENEFDKIPYYHFKTDGEEIFEAI